MEDCKYAVIALVLVLIFCGVRVLVDHDAAVAVFLVLILMRQIDQWLFE